MLSPNLLSDSIIKNRQNGLNWFKTVNPKAYMVLFEDNASGEKEKSINPEVPGMEKSVYSSGVLPKEVIEKIEYGAKLSKERSGNKEEEEENREIYNWDYEFDDSTNEWKKYDESYNGLNEIYYDDATNDGLKTTFTNKNEKKEGLQKIYYEKDDDSNSQELRCELNWKDGKKEGKYKYYFRGDSECESKVMEEGFFKNDEQSGIWKHFYEYGGYEEGKYRGNYKKIGVWKYYNEYDKLDEERDFGE